MNRPYISFIVTARNDNYGGNFLHRIQVFVNVLIALCEKYKLEMELIIVEWNPPKDAPRLKDAIKWPKMTQGREVRLIEVPNEVYQGLSNSTGQPIFEWIAKNVGIRRAKGEYILTTNADILFNEELIEFLSEKKLSPDYFYRVDRYDVKSPVPLDVSVDEQLNYCKNNIISRFSRFSQIGAKLEIKDVFNLSRGYLGYLKRRILYFPSVPPHTNAAGDFLLAPRDSWNGFRGFPELKVRLHIDSYACYIALAAGLKEFVLHNPMRIYHQDHNRREALPGLVPFDYKLYKKQCRQMAKKHKPVIFNDENWGLSEKFFQENIVK